jgi:tRNA(adenine34) deaminase
MGPSGMGVRELDEFYMRRALAQAQKAYNKGEVPVGALVVAPDGTVIGRGYNSTEHDHTQSSHAEMKALRQAGKKLKDWRLTGCTLYVTVQPCFMCIGLTYLSRIERLVYGAESPLFGYLLDNESVPDLYKKHIKGITRGVLADETQAILKDFFKKKRK